MEQEIYVTEIQKSGIVSAVQGALKSNCNIALPNVEIIYLNFMTPTLPIFLILKENLYSMKNHLALSFRQ